MLKLLPPLCMPDVPTAHLLSVLQVCIGADCQVGHKAVLPAGSRLAGGLHLKPRTAPSHPGAVGKGAPAVVLRVSSSAPATS